MRRYIALLLGSAAIATACARSEPAILVGAVYPTGGHQGPGGIEEYRGVELAAQYVNQYANKKATRPVRLKLRPTEHREDAPAAVDELAETGAQVIVGSYGSTISVPAARAAERHGLVFWETGAVGDLPMGSSGSPTAFRFPASGRVLGKQAVAFVRDQLHIGEGNVFTVAYVDDVYGSSVARGAIDEIRASGLALGADLPYDLTKVDYEDLVDRVGKAGTDVLVVVAYLDDGVALRRAVVKRDLDLKANIGTSSSYCMIQFGALLGPDAVGLFASDKPDGASVDAGKLKPEAAEALEWARRTYKQRHRAAMTAPALTGFAGAMALFGHVLPAATSITAASIARAAERADVPRGALPDGSGLRFTSSRANERATNVIWEWVARERREVVWPPALASHAIVTDAH